MTNLDLLHYYMRKLVKAKVRTSPSDKWLEGLFKNEISHTDKTGWYVMTWVNIND